MKKTIFLHILAALCLFFSARAQDKIPLRPLRTGDRLPDLTFRNVLHSPAPVIRLADYKGQWLIIDFWATWCSPCVAMLPRIDSLQAEFAGRLRFLPVSYQKRSEIMAMEARYSERYQRQLHLPEVVEDTALHQLFPHATIPRYVWIDPGGRVAAFTEFDQINAGKIRQMLGGDTAAVVQAKGYTRIPYNVYRPLVVQNNGGKGDNLLYHSILTSYTQGLGSGYAILHNDTTGVTKITVRNNGIYTLFQIAFSDLGQFRETNTRMAVRDTSRLVNFKASGQKYREWLSEGNGYCYELVVPKELAASAFKMMRADLDRLLTKYQGTVARRERECLVLERTGQAAATPPADGEKPDVIIDAYQWKAVNVRPEVLVDRINFFGVMPEILIDETGIKAPVDITVRLPAGRPDPDKLNGQLAAYHLKLTRKKRMVDELVISDRQP